MKPLIGFAGLVFCLLTSGCSQQTIESATRDTAKNVQVVSREANRAERKLRPEVKKLNMGVRVTTALKANENLPLTIRVDADDKGVKLRGKVQTEAQKTLAERIARDTLDSEKTVTNDLKVEPK